MVSDHKIWQGSSSRWRAVRRGAWIVLAVAACVERITAPGACPDYCPAEDIVAIDTVLTSVVVGDSSFRGYRNQFAAGSLHLVPIGTPHQAVGVVRFSTFLARLDGNGDTVLVQDSFGLTVTVRRRAPGATGLELAVYRLPDWADSTVTLTQLLPWFDDSTLLAVAAVPDTLSDGQNLHVTMDSLALLPEIRARQAPVLGLALRAPGETFLNVGSIEAASTATLARYVESDSTSAIVDGATATFDTFVIDDPPALTADVLTIGGVPSARAVLRMDLPRSIIDSAEISRATLILVPSEPIDGVLSDSIELRAAPVFTDVGRKSPAIDQLATRLGQLALDAGSADSVFLEITEILRQWRVAPELPRTLVLWVSPEASGTLQVRFWSSQGLSAPGLRLTYIPPVRSGQ
ncbi:MAG TPA: hypothetical protein VGA22_01835 [Gemmatimonadales bacterium]|jgi:hypothetical protein